MAPYYQPLSERLVRLLVHSLTPLAMNSWIYHPGVSQANGEAQKMVMGTLANKPRLIMGTPKDTDGLWIFFF